MLKKSCQGGGASAELKLHLRDLSGDLSLSLVITSSGSYFSVPQVPIHNEIFLEVVGYLKLNNLSLPTGCETMPS